MIEDIMTVMWKEVKELIAMQGTLKGGMIRLLISFGILGVYLPMMFGRSFIEAPFLLLLYIWFPMFMGIAIVLDSIAGERERHTLETLLASRLSDRAILYGKIASGVLYGFSMTLVFIAIGVAVVNVAFWDGHILIYPFETIVFVLLAALLANILLAAVGVLVSLHAQTVRQGSETLMVAIIAIAAIPFILYYVLPDSLKIPLINALLSMGITNIELAAVLVLAAICAMALYAAMLSFRRNKLILD
jgi:ABC-2 type transport system permease protein